MAGFCGELTAGISSLSDISHLERERWRRIIIDAGVADERQSWGKARAFFLARLPS